MLKKKGATMLEAQTFLLLSYLCDSEGRLSFMKLKLMAM